MSARVKLIASGLVWLFSLLVAIDVFRAWQWLVCLALAFSWLGDALLARYEPLTRKIRDPFIAGMGAFAIAQVVYIIAFSMSLKGMPLLHARIPGYLLGIELLGSVTPIYLLAGVLFWLLVVCRSDKDANLKAATLVYCLLLCTMAAHAFCAAFTGVFTAWPLILGGILFMISDGCIAMRIFKDRLADPKRYEIAVWGTYLPAQICLLWGAAVLY